jgi:hypothetical protein
MKFHEAAELLPLMAATELAELTADIKAYGQREPIYTYQGKIIDGRNRFLACRQAGVEPQFREWSGEGSLIAFVVSENVRRRHLSSTQKAVIGEAALELYEKEAALRLKTSSGGKTPRPVEKIPRAETGKARDKAARAAGTNGHYISDVKAIKAIAPALIPLMRDGKLSIVDGKLAARLPADDLAAIVIELDKGATFHQARCELQKNSLPDPGQARKQVLDDRRSASLASAGMIAADLSPLLDADIETEFEANGRVNCSQLIDDLGKLAKYREIMAKAGPAVMSKWFASLVRQRLHTATVDRVGDPEQYELFPGRRPLDLPDGVSLIEEDGSISCVPRADMEKKEFRLADLLRIIHRRPHKNCRRR